MSEHHKSKALYFEKRGDPDNAITIVLAKSGELCVSVSEEQAVDSYNSTFECSFNMSTKETAALRDYLNRNAAPAWTTEPPTKPGWYWYAPKNGDPPYPVECRQDDSGLRFYFWHYGTVWTARDLRERGASWLGPIEPPAV